MDDRPYTKAEALNGPQSWDDWCDNYADWVDFLAVRDAKDVARVSGAHERDGGVGDSEHEGAGVDETRMGAALDRPPGLGGPREFAVQGHQLIALMEHVAAVRRLARRGWRSE